MKSEHFLPFDFATLTFLSVYSVIQIKQAFLSLIECTNVLLCFMR